MDNLVAFERRNQILDHLRTNRRASTRTLSDLFRVSEVTIRHDLQKLADGGWISRIHGGAEVGPRLEEELPMSVRETQNLPAKKRIAKTALDFVQDGDTILLDSSTTALQLTHYLKERQNLTIFTNNLRVAHLVCPVKSCEVVILGGSVRSETWSIVGPLAEEFIAGLRIDKGFFGAAGVSLERGLTDADMREVQIKRRMAEVSRQIYALVDTTKFGKEAFSTTIALERVDCLITDDLPSEFDDYLTPLGTQIVVVS
jgi:DeoR family transcriptional regulator, fructose operon transcriptional repressor